MNPLTPAVIPAPGAVEQLVEMILATYGSEATRRMYRSYLTAFLKSSRPLTREGVALYVQAERDRGAGQPTIQGILSSVKKLAAEAQLRGLISFETFHGIDSVPAGRYQRQHSGNWLTVPQVEQLLALPDRSTYWGKRDACILSLMLGCGLRRREMATMEWERHYQERDGRMCLVDFKGKGNKTRTVPVPTWAQADADAWYAASRGPAPIPVTHMEKAQAWNRRVDHKLITGGLTYEGLVDLITTYSTRLGVYFSSHDLRRSLAQMLRRAGAPLEQIQYTLGHSDIATTIIYLGSQLELAPGKAAVDVLKINNPVYRNRGIPPEGQDTLYAHLEKERREIRRIQAEAKRPTRGGAA